MATTEEVQKLVMQVEGEAKLRALVAQQVEAEKVMRKLVEQFNEGKLSQQDYAKRTEIVASHVLRLREQTEETEKSFRKAGFSVKNYQQEIRSAGFIVQDFAQGGLGGIINNIDQLLYKFPMLGAAATIGATAIWAFGPAVKSMVEGLLMGTNKIPEATGHLEKMAERLGKAKEELDKLKDKQSLTNAELAKYNELMAETKGLEEGVQKAREQRNAYEAQVKAENAAPQGAAEEAKRIVEEAGGAEKVRDSVLRKLEDFSGKDQLEKQIKELQEYRKEIRKLPGQMIASEYARVDKEIKEAQAKLEATAKETADKAKSMVGAALTGDQGAVRDLDTLMPGLGIGAATPEGMRRRAEGEAAGRKTIGGILDNILDAAKANREWNEEIGLMNRLEEQGQMQRQAQEQRAMLAKDEGEKQWQAKQDAKEAEELGRRLKAEERARKQQEDEARRKFDYNTANLYGDKPMEGDALEAASLEAERASIAAVAQADAMMGQNSVYVQRFQEITARLNHLQMRNSQQMGGQMGGGGYSQLPMYTGGM